MGGLGDLEGLAPARWEVGRTVRKARAHCARLRILCSICYLE